MSKSIRAAFYLRLRFKQQQIAESPDSTTAGLLASAQSMAEAWLGQPEADNDRTSNAEDTKAILEIFWYTVILAARAANEFNEQEAVVEMVRKTQKMDDSQSVTAEHLNRSTRLTWSSLPHFRAVLFEEFLRSPPLVSTQQWTNLHAFAARLTAARVEDLTFYAQWAFMDAFEDKPLDTQHMEQSWTTVQPALIWIEHCGTVLHQSCLQNGNAPDQRPQGYLYQWHHQEPEFVGPIAHEAGVKQSGFCVDRWSFWKSQMQTLKSATSDAEDGSLQASNLSIGRLLQSMQSAETA